MIKRIVTIAMLSVLGGCSSGQPDVNTDPASGTVLASGTGTEDGDERKSTAATLGIPPGHLPPPGQCKIWMPGEPPGQQKKKFKSGDCSYVRTQVPPGGWLVFRPTKDKKEVRVSVYDNTRPEVVAIRFFDVATGVLLREEPGS